MTSIYDLSWRKISFLAKIWLLLKSRKQEKEKMRSDNLWVQAGGYSALSSTYYSIVGTAFAQLKAALRPKWLALVKVTTWCLTWFPLAGYCYWRMLPLSDRVVELVGYNGMSADWCDIRQSVLRLRGQYDEAKQCIIVAFAKNPEKAHTRGLLHIGFAEIYRREGYNDKAVTEVCCALVEAEKAEKQDPMQAERIYRQSANLSHQMCAIGNLPPANELYDKANKLAQATGARDQILKLYQ
ncbi:MAG: hypothetical protein AAB614_00785 [Patescibacteria group bacterium]